MKLRRGKGYTQAEARHLQYRTRGVKLNQAAILWAPGVPIFSVVFSVSSLFSGFSIFVSAFTVFLLSFPFLYMG